MDNLTDALCISMPQIGAVEDLEATLGHRLPTGWAHIVVFTGVEFSEEATADDLFPDVVPILSRNTMGTLQYAGAGVVKDNTSEAWLVAVQYVPPPDLQEIRTKTVERYYGASAAQDDAEASPGWARVIVASAPSEEEANAVLQLVTSPLWVHRLCVNHVNIAGSFHVRRAGPDSWYQTLCASPDADM